MEALRRPKFIITYNGKDITSDLSNTLMSVSYSDKTEGESDEITINLEDTDGLWRGAWYPTKGDKLGLQFGYADTGLVDGGQFEVDEIELQGPPDTVSIRGIATGISKAVRTKNSKAYEKQTLKQIAETIASKHGMSVTGEIDAVTFTRVTQNRENDLSFLKRISEEYGHVFAIRDSKLVFSRLYDLEKGKPVLAIDRTDLLSYSIRDKTSNTFKKAVVKYHDPTDKTVKEFEESSNTNADGAAIEDTTADDTIEVRTKAENTNQAQLKAKAAMYRANSRQKEGSITVIGNPLLLAGNNIELTGLGTISGKYHIMESTHSIDGSGGYVTNLNLKLVGFIQKEKQKSTRPRKDTSTYRVIS
jgi:phage protein D